MMVRFMTLLAAAAMFTVTLAANAQGAMIVFDDADQNGWATSDWWMSTQTDNVYEGSTALATSNGQITSKHAGFIPGAGADAVFTFYLDAAETVTNVMVVVNSSERKTDVYSTDGVANGGGYINIDGTPGEWQKFEWDSSQWATGTPITDLRVAQHWSGSGNDNSIVADLLYFGTIPEPATMALLGAGGLVIFRRRTA